MSRLLRPLLFGLLAGLLLGWMRAPAGLDWTQVPGVEGTTRALFRAGGLFAVAVFLRAGRPAFAGRTWAIWVFLGALVGLVGGSLLVEPPFDLPEPLAGRTGYGLLLVAALPLLGAAAGRVRDGGEPSDSEPAAPLERIALAVCGIGLALALETLAGALRPFGGGLAIDDTLFAGVFVAALFVGALAFGPMVARESLARLGLATGSALAAAAAGYGLHRLLGMSSEELWGLLKRFDLDHSRISSPGADAVLAGTVLVIPGLLLGAGAVAARAPARLRSLLLGAALGLLLQGPALALSAPGTHTPEAAGRQVAQVALMGTGLCALGSLVLLLRRQRALLVGALLALAAPLALSRLPAVPYGLAPWFTSPLHAARVIPTAAGTVALQTLPSGATMVTVDGQRVTPTPQEEEADDRRLLTALRLLPASAGTSPRILYVGVLTARRADLLRRVAPEGYDRTVPWPEAQRELDEVLLGPEEGGPARLIQPALARKRLSSGKYDLVYVPETTGPLQNSQSANRISWGVSEAPVLGALDLPLGSVGVAWVRANSTLARRHLGKTLLASLDRLTDLVVGVVRGVHEVPTGSEDHLEPPLLLSGDAPARGSEVDLLGTIPWFRGFGLARETAERIAEATERSAPDSRAAHTARGLALHLAAQKPSSPFDSNEAAVEVTEDALRAWMAALRSEPGMDPLTRALWVDLAHVLTVQRDPDLVLAFVEPVADAYGPWPALDAAAARAHRELLDPEAALARFERALPGARGNIDLAVEAAETAREAGKPERAVELVREALQGRPGTPALLRQLAISLHATGAPEADAMLRALLERDPDDEEVRGLLEVGPSPEGESG